MRLCNYTLSPTRINNAKPKGKLYKLTDGGGLFIEVSAAGLKTWRYQYRFGGVRREVTIGKFPEVGVADARDRHFELRSLLERSIDPLDSRRQKLSEQKERATEGKSAGNDFEAFSKRWVRERLTTKSDTYRKQIESRLERFIWPAIGTRALNAVRPADVLEIIEGRRDTPKTAEGLRAIIQQIYNYAIQKLLVEVNPALPLRGVIEVPPAEHHRHLSEPELGAFWRSVERQGAHFATIASTKLLMYSMCRKSEVLRARWREFDLEKGQWDLPAERMKMRTPHIVPLSSQAITLLRTLKTVSGHSALLFPGERDHEKPMSNNTILKALERMGYKHRMTGHGFRGIASTVLHEMGFDHAHIELQLAHQERNKVSASYNHATYLPQRAKMMQQWSDYLDACVSDKVRAFKRRA